MRIKTVITSVGINYMSLQMSWWWVQSCRKAAKPICVISCPRDQTHLAVNKAHFAISNHYM